MPATEATEQVGRLRDEGRGGHDERWKDVVGGQKRQEDGEQ